MNRNTESITIGDLPVRVQRFATIVVGSGAAGLNAALRLSAGGQASVAIVTEGLEMGTSRNTGSDKQTYYKLTTSGGLGDSVRGMAATLHSGGAMDGDIALAEAALSAQCFFRLVELGVPFPHNAYGEYVGYKTDHDPVKRGTSAGPLTSKFMTERLLAAVEKQGLVSILDKHHVIEILTAPEAAGGERATGLLALDLANIGKPELRYVLLCATDIVYATGGEAGMYETSVYPTSQTGGTGAALRAGVRGKNLTESQYGLASIKFRWNLSGTYQQTLPRYISTDRDGGDEREFLDPFFPDRKKLLSAIFLKGYQWPFDPAKIAGAGSSLIDVLVYHEMQTRGRRVFLDYTRNPSAAETNGAIDFSLLDPEVRDYLANSDALLATPIARLLRMNPAAVELYQSHGIDLTRERLEIAVSAQHNNGGLAADSWWESDLRHFFPVGEVNGSHGVYRPGGSALNSGQVGGLRAAQRILNNDRGAQLEAADVVRQAAGRAEAAIRYGEKALSAGLPPCDPQREIEEIRKRMTRHGAHIRSTEGVEQGLAEASAQLARLEKGVGIETPRQLRRLHQLRDLALCHFVYLSAIRDYIQNGGASRGSYLVHDPAGQAPAAGLPEAFRFGLDGGKLKTRIQEIRYADGRCETTWRDARPLPPEDDWFETVWRRYLRGETFAR